MKRKFISCMLLLILTAQLLFPAFATENNEQSTKVCSSYWSDGMLYAFAQFSDDEPEAKKAMLLVNKAMVQESYPCSLETTGASIHYVLLIDTSTSMAKYRSRISDLARRILDSKQNVSISIAQFGKEFVSISSEMSEWKDVNSTLCSLAYNSGGSNISGSVAAVMEILGKNGYDAAGEMTNLVVITDGEPWYSNDPQTNQMQAGQSNAAAVQMMAAYPEIVLHTYSFGVWDKELQEILSDARGLHGTDISANEMGRNLAAYADSMYALNFELLGYNDQSQITDELLLLIERSYFSFGRVRNAGVVPNVIVDTEAPTENETESGPAEETMPEETIDTVPTVPDETIGSDETTEATQPDETTGENHTGQNQKKEKKWCFWFGVGGVAIFLAVILILIFRRNQAYKNSIRMRIELVAGQNVRLRREYHLAHEVLIGSERNCDVLLPPFNGRATYVRIFKQNQIPYVEDIGMSEEVLLNGMRIFSSNRLRSGDEITIGTVTLRVLF